MQNLKRSYSGVGLVGGILFSITVSACSGVSFKPEREELQLDSVQRGWAFIESSDEMADMEISSPPINFSSAILQGDLLYVGTGRFGIQVFNKHSGNLVWRRKVPGGITSDIAILNKKIVVGTNEGFAHAYPLGGGKVLWTQNLRFPVVGKPVFLAGRILIGTVDHALHSLDASTGKILWTYRRSSATGTTIKGGGNATVIAGKFWVGFADGSLAVLEPNDGSVLREKQFRDNLKFTDIDAPPVPWRSGVFVSTYDGRLRYIKRNGLPIWTFPKGSAKPVIPGGEKGSLFLPSSDGTIYAISEKSGKRIWSYTVDRGVPTGLAYFPSLAAKGTTAGLLVAASSDNFLYILDASNGSLKQRISLGSSSGAYGSIAVDNKEKAFYLVSHYGRVYQFQVH